MTLNVLIGVNAEYAQDYERAVARLQNVKIVGPDKADQVDVIVYEPNQGFDDFSVFPNLRYVQSIWAGADSVIGNPSLKVPFARLVDDGLSEGMREYMLGHILADHIEVSRFETATKWDDRWLPLARTKTLGIVGFGTLGQSVARAGSALGFNILGWSQSAKSSPFENYSGADGFAKVLSSSDYIVLLLPHTNATKDIINTHALGLMRSNAMILNAGRGALIDEDALIRALDDGVIRRAVLDVFKTEPLPEHHPFWSHPKVVVTPHIAAKSRVETAVEIIAKNLDNYANKRPLDFVVDFDRGY